MASTLSLSGINCSGESQLPCHKNIQSALKSETIPKKKKCKKAKWLSAGGLEIAEKRKEKGKGLKERYTHLNAEFQRLSSLEKEMATHSSGFLAQRIPWMEEPGGLPSMGSKSPRIAKSDTTEQLRIHFHFQPSAETFSSCVCY